jgi:hypothetical protein
VTLEIGAPGYSPVSVRGYHMIYSKLICLFALHDSHLLDRASSALSECSEIK